MKTENPESEREKLKNENDGQNENNKDAQNATPANENDDPK